MQVYIKKFLYCMSSYMFDRCAFFRLPIFPYLLWLFQQNIRRNVKINSDNDAFGRDLNLISEKHHIGNDSCVSFDIKPALFEEIVSGQSCKTHIFTHSQEGNNNNMIK